MMAGFGVRALCMFLAALAIVAPASLRGQVKETPYWASISSGEARMRVGPSKDYPANWVYRRRNLPVKVLQVHSNWRKIEDPSGTQGWMHVQLLSDTTTAIVVVNNGEIRSKRDDKSSMLYRVQKGVVGKISECKDGWCLVDVEGQRGFILASSLWGPVN
ncbi:MAG: hypothetical protein KDE67_01380 [Sphingobium sp.]|nr:hypothetical protein [Sphingobium sp.]MCP5400167.1 hypothetical protein [Sphingomonas sp.]